MTHLDVVKRAWQTVWTYRALWIFGVVLALVAFSWPTAFVLDRGDEASVPGLKVTVLDGETFWAALDRTVAEEITEANQDLHTFLDTELGIDWRPHILAIVAILIAASFVALVVAKTARYVSETALIRMVDVYQETGEKLRAGQGLRLGWSRRAWRLFVVDLSVTLVAALIGILLFSLILGPLPLWVNGNEGVIFTFALLTGGLFFLAIFAMIVVGTAARVWKRLTRQICALDDVPPGEAIRRGWRLLVGHLKEAGITWALSLGVRVAWAAALVPLVLLLFGAATLVGGLPGVAAGALAGLAASGDTPIFVGIGLGAAIFLLVLVGPLLLLAGLREVFISSLWTVTYREMRRLPSREPASVPTVDPSSLSTAPT